MYWQLQAQISSLASLQERLLACRHFLFLQISHVQTCGLQGQIGRFWPTSAEKDRGPRAPGPGPVFIKRFWSFGPCCTIGALLPSSVCMTLRKLSNLLVTQVLHLFYLIVLLHIMMCCMISYFAYYDVLYDLVLCCTICCYTTLYCIVLYCIVFVAPQTTSGLNP